MKKIIMILLLLTLTACDNQTFISDKYRGTKTVLCENEYDSDFEIYSNYQTQFKITAFDNYITSLVSTDRYEFSTNRSKQELTQYNLNTADEIFTYLKRFEYNNHDDFNINYTLEDDVMIIRSEKIIPSRKDGFFGLIVPESNALSEFMEDDFQQIVYNCEIK